MRWARKVSSSGEHIGRLPTKRHTELRKIRQLSASDADGQFVTDRRTSEMGPARVVSSRRAAEPLRPAPDMLLAPRAEGDGAPSARH